MKFKNGFMMVEAILSVALVSASLVMKAKFDKEATAIEEAERFAIDLVDVVSAVDRRVFLDGIHNPAGWDNRWNDSTSVITEAFGKELVGLNNPDCGVIDGWAPNHAENNTLALLPCSFMKVGAVPMGMQVTSERVGSADGHIQSWKFHFYSDTAKSFDKNFKHYSRVVNTATARKKPSITGVFNFKLVDLATGSQLTLSECSDRTTQCAISAEYETNRTGISEDYHLRVNGTNSMLNNLTFRAPVGGDLIGCKRTDGDGTNTREVPCGLEIVDDKDLALNVNGNVTSAGLHLVGKDALGVLAPVMCDKDGDLKACGVTVVSSNGSTYAEAYLHSLHTKKAVTDMLEAKDIYIDSGSFNVGAKGAGGVFNPSLKIDALSGDLATKGGILADKKITTNEGITSNGNIEINGNATIRGGAQIDALDAGYATLLGLTVSGSHVTSSDGRKINALFEGDVDVEGKLKGDKLETNTQINIANSQIVGDPCSELGAISKASDGSLLNCKSGKWSVVGGLSPVTIFEDKNGIYKYTDLATLQSYGTGLYMVTISGAGSVMLHIDDINTLSYSTSNSNATEGFGVWYKPSEGILGVSRAGPPIIKKIMYISI